MQNVNQLIQTAQAAADNHPQLKVYGGCARIYIQATDNVSSFDYSDTKEGRAEYRRASRQARKNNQKILEKVCKALDGRWFDRWCPVTRTNVKAWYVGYDNATRREYSWAMAVCDALTKAGLYCTVTADED